MDTYYRELSDKIVKCINNNTFFGKIENERTHMEQHVIKNDVELLDRVLNDIGSTERKGYSQKERKAINSGFKTLDEARFNIEECMINSSKEIAKWIDGAKTHEKKDFVVPLRKEEGYDPVGYGYIVSRKTNTIDEYATDSIRVVLEQNSNSEFGFSLLTAYPDIIHAENREPTGKDLSAIVKKTNTYQKASPVSKAYMLYQTGKNKPYLITFKEGLNGNTHDDVLSLHIPYQTKKGDECKHIIRFKEDSIELSTSKMMKINVATWKDKYTGKEREKVIYPDEDIRKYQREGTTIEQKDRFVKQKSFFTRHFNPKDEKALNVDLTRKEVFEEFQKRYPDVAEIVTELSKVLNIETVGIKEKDILSKRKIENEAVLNESLLPQEETSEQMQFGIA